MERRQNLGKSPSNHLVRWYLYLFLLGFPFEGRTVYMNLSPRLLVALFLAHFVCAVGWATVPETVITEPASVRQYDDALVIYLHGFDVMRSRYPALELRYRLVSANGFAGDETTADLTQPWETPAFIIRKDTTEYAGILVSAVNGQEVFFRRYYQLDGTVNAPSVLPTLAQNAAIELGQFVTEAPTIPLPDRSNFGSLPVGTPSRTFDIDANTLQVRSDINYPQVSSGQLCALSRQTDFPNDTSKRSLYVPLKSQFFDQATGKPAGVRHYICEIPLDSGWLNGSEDLAINLSPSQIKVHQSSQKDGNTNILGGGGGGLGQITGSMAVDADGNIYFSSSVPTDVVRFNVSTATFEVPPTDLFPLSNQYLPTDNDILGNGGTGKNGRWQTYRMVASMNHSVPSRMIYARTISRLVFSGTLYEWSAIFTLPTRHWDDAEAFAGEFNLLVGSWPSAEYSLYDDLPVTDGPLRRIQYFKSYGNTVYAQPYPKSIGGPWRVDITADNQVEAFGTKDTMPNYSDATSKPVDTLPYNASSKIDFRDYGLLTMDRSGLHYCLTGTTDNSLTGQIEVTYDAIAHMLEDPTAFADILANIGGPSLSPSYMSTPLPGKQGKLLGVGEYGYYLAEFDVNRANPGIVEKEFLDLDSPDPNQELPMALGLGPYGYQWTNIDGDDWLYIGGYIGMTRMKYTENGIPLGRYTMQKFDTSLTNIPLDARGGGAIKRYRYMQHGLDGRMFLTGTHTAARGGTAYSGGLLSFHPTELNTLWRLSYMSRSFHTVRMRNRVLRDTDGVPVQEFCARSYFEPEYAHTIPSGLVPANTNPKVFQWDYKSGGQMRDLMGFSVASLDGSFGLNDIAYSNDRRYLILQQGSQLLTFDPQANRFVDGKTLDYGTDLKVASFERPSYSFTRAPDDRLFLYLRPSGTSTHAVFLQIQVSPSGELSVTPHLQTEAETATAIDTSFSVQHCYLQDYTNGDGSYDLFLGQKRSTSGGGTVCRVIEDFIPPRRHQIERTVNVLSSGAGHVTVTGSKPGTTPYRATCTNGENITLTAVAPAGHVFKRWVDEDGNLLGTGQLGLTMSVDRAVTAVFSPAQEMSNLLITQIHHSPEAPSADEISAGYPDNNQFEFLELMNTGNTTLDLGEAVLSGAGITFDFSTGSIQQLAPGARILLLADNDAFTERYGTSAQPKVTGQYPGNLADGTGALTLTNAGTNLYTFTYGHQAPWPTAQGYSLVLLHPLQQTPMDLKQGVNWRSSVDTGGSPGTSDALQYDTWKNSFGNPPLEPDVDDDGDGRANLIEYLQDTAPRTPDRLMGTLGDIETLEVENSNNSYFVIRVLQKVGTDDVSVTIEQSEDLKVWTPTQTQFMGRERLDGSPVEWLRFRSTSPVTGYYRYFVRMNSALK